MIPKNTTLLIFAAGLGTRMGTVTQTIPKPMLRLRDKPMVDHALDTAKTAGIETIFANTHHLHEEIAPHFIRSNVTPLREHPEILDTGGGLKSARQHLSSPTLTLNPDCDWSGPNPLTYLLRNWRDDMQSLLLVVSLDRATNRSAPGDFTLSGTHLARGGNMVYTGAQLIRTERLTAISSRVFSLNVFWDHLAESKDLHGLVYPGKWTDIGTKAALAKANGAHLV